MKQERIDFDESKNVNKLQKKRRLHDIGDITENETKKRKLSIKDIKNIIDKTDIIDNKLSINSILIFGILMICIGTRMYGILLGEYGKFIISFTIIFLMWLFCSFWYSAYHVYHYPYCCSSTVAANKYFVDDTTSLDIVNTKWNKLTHFKNIYIYNIWCILCCIIMIIFIYILSIIWLLMYGFYIIYDSDYLYIGGVKHEKCLNNNCKSVAIIGAAPSGLITAKILKDYGHKVTIFEQTECIGGCFKSSYNGYLTTSNLITEFSMFPIKISDIDNKEIDINKGVILKFSEYINYLTRFVNHFNLFKNIKFNHKICNIKKCDNNKWIFYYKKNNHFHNDEIFEYKQCKFDHFIICTGTTGKPQYPNLDNFNGDIIHSSQYFGNEYNKNIIKNKNVLIIGFGESGSDISYLVSKDAKQCILSSRNGPGTLIGRYGRYGYASDIDTSRMNHACREYEKFYYNMKFRIYSWLRSPFYHPKRANIIRHIMSHQKPRRGIFQRFGTKSQNAINGILYHGLKYKPGIKTILSDNKSIKFIDNTTFENIDTIICCTGYISNFFPYLHSNIGDSSLFNPTTLYKHQFHPDFGESFCFIGYNRANLGSLIALSELSARYYAQIISNIKQLPNKKEMITDINKQYERNKHNFPDDYNTKPTITDFLQTNNELSKIIGCKPNLYKLFIINPYVWYKVITGPIMACHHRIFGPNRIDIKIIENKLKKIPILPFGIHTYQLFTYFLVQILNYFTKQTYH